MKEIYVKVGDMYVRTYNHPFIEFSFNQEDAGKFDKFKAANMVIGIGNDIARLVETELLPVEKVYEIDEFHIHNGKLTGFSQREIKGEKK